MTSERTPRATLTVADGIATIVLAGPDPMNPIDAELASDLRACVETADGDPDVAVILTVAEGTSWCVGGAVKTFAALETPVHDYINDVGADIVPLVARLHRSSKVTVAAVHGPIAGGGIGLMAAHDLVIADPGVSVTIAYRRLGLSPDAGGTVFLVRDLGYRRALELYLTDGTLSAEEAQRGGLVSRLSAPGAVRAEAQALAAGIAAGPRSAQATTKRLFRQAADVQLERQLEDEIRSLADETLGADFSEGLAALIQRRRPVFAGSEAVVA